MISFLRSRTESSYRSALILTIFLALLISAWVVGPDALADNNGTLLILYGVILSLAFATQVSEIYFTKPNDVVVNGITCLIIMLPQRLYLEGSPLYWLILAFASLGLAAALLSNVLFEPANGVTPRGLSKFFLNIAQLVGGGRLLFGMCAFLLILRNRDESQSIIVALVAVLALLLLTPSAFRAFITNLRSKERAEGHVAQILGNDRVKVKFRRRIQSDDFVIVGLADISRVGVPVRIVPGASDFDVDVHLLSPENVPQDLISRQYNVANGVARVVDPPDQPPQLLGVVTENTDVLSVAYRPISGVSQATGDIVAATIGSREVYYQIQNATISIEPTIGADKCEFVQVKAAQLGVWDPDRQIFDREGWVPSPNSAIRRPTGFPAVNPAVGEVALGNIPGTDFMVSMDYRDAITHHTAVLGVTGVGKSVFVREFMRNIPPEAAKFICVDITGEYISRIPNAISLISDPDRVKIATWVDEVYRERAKFASQQNPAYIDQKENAIRALFVARIQAFLAGGDQTAVLEMADLDGTLQNYEYLKWFFRAAFLVAKSRPQPASPLLSLILEEAHTIVPEWNFLGDSDRSAGHVVNSISQVALQGRKYGVGLVVIGQRTANISKTVLTQCNTVICFQQFDRTSFEFLNSFMGGNAEQILPNLKLRTAVAAGKAIRSTAPLVFKVPDVADAVVAVAVEDLVPLAGADPAEGQEGQEIAGLNGLV